jgi:hypothetical protein
METSSASNVVSMVSQQQNGNGESQLLSDSIGLLELADGSSHLTMPGKPGALSYAALELSILRACVGAFQARNSLIKRLPAQQTWEYANAIGAACEQAVCASLLKDAVPARVALYGADGAIQELTSGPLYLVMVKGNDCPVSAQGSPFATDSATMIALYNGPNPCFGDYAICAVLDHASKELLLAVKHEGSFLLRNKLLRNGQEQALCLSHKGAFGPKTRLVMDRTDKFNQLAFQDMLDRINTVDLHYATGHYWALLTGGADVVLQSSNSLNFEPAVYYGLVCEAGGNTTLSYGLSCAEGNVLEYGRAAKLSFLSASSCSLTASFIKVHETGRDDELDLA